MDMPPPFVSCHLFNKVRKRKLQQEKEEKLQRAQARQKAKEEKMKSEREAKEKELAEGYIRLWVTVSAGLINHVHVEEQFVLGTAVPRTTKMLFRLCFFSPLPRSLTGSMCRRT